MATRSAIGYIRPDGSIRAVYCHWDGYPEHQLPILQADYNGIRKVQTLIRPGSMSALRTPETWESDYQRDPQPLYHHERGLGPWSAGDTYGDPPLIAPTLGQALNLWRDYGCEHLYAFSREDGWHHYAIN